MPEQRPHDLTPAQLGFHPQPAIRWLNPGLLVGTGVRVLVAHLFGAFLDKRELQAALPDPVHDHGEGSELWLDYTADVGDGFDATYAVAYLLAQPELAVEGTEPLPRGRVLVLGGDQVYPTASVRAYEDRWKGPYRAALPAPGPASPTLYAIPGNHDWYDGLTAFLRLFAQEEPVGGWRTAQHRSYFALRLPHRWWLFAVDVQLDSYVDEPQLKYFLAAAEELGPGDRVILVQARPAWVMTDEYPEAYDSIDYVIRHVLEPTGARIPLLLAGDYHHYSRYSGPGPDGNGRTLITCGGGGAYLTSTEHLPSEVAVPSPRTVARAASTPRRYELRGSYPSKSASRRLGWGVFARLPLRNPGFVALLGLMQTLLMLAVLTLQDGRWINFPTAVAGGAVFVGTIFFALLIDKRGARYWVAGILHGLPHLGLGVAGAAAWAALPLADLANPWNVLAAFVVYLPVAGVVDSWVLGAYLLVARYAGINVNELFAGMGIEDHKSFLRLHIGPDGALTVYPVGVERVPDDWRADPSGAPGASWIVPDEPLRAHLIEQPVRVT